LKTRRGGLILNRLGANPAAQNSLQSEGTLLCGRRNFGAKSEGQVLNKPCQLPCQDTEAAEYNRFYCISLIQFLKHLNTGLYLPVQFVSLQKRNEIFLRFFGIIVSLSRNDNWKSAQSAFPSKTIRLLFRFRETINRESAQSAFSSFIIGKNAQGVFPSKNTGENAQSAFSVSSQIVIVVSFETTIKTFCCFSAVSFETAIETTTKLFRLPEGKQNNFSKNIVVSIRKRLSKFCQKSFGCQIQPKHNKFLLKINFLFLTKNIYSLTVGSVKRQNVVYPGENLIGFSFGINLDIWIVNVSTCCLHIFLLKHQQYCSFTHIKAGIPTCIYIPNIESNHLNKLI
jgi:hypothetical protein